LDVSVLTFVTDFADQAVVLPVALAIACVLAAAGWWRGLVAWLIGIGGTIAAMATLKVVFMACGHLVPEVGLRSPSGHTASATVLGAGLAALLERKVGRSGTLIAVAAAVGAAVLIGFSRLHLHMHSVPEVIAGGLVGLAGGIALVRLAGPPPPSLRRAPVITTVVLIVVLLHGRHLGAESWIHRAALYVGPLSVCRPG
jgi:membrane-associated phospholipid phosphatase